jgi:hypothetical protein
MYELSGGPPPLEWLHALSMGRVPGYSAFLMQGTNPDTDVATTPEDVRPNGGLTVFPTTNVAMQILSDSASDAAAGVGARTVRVDGLNALFAPVTETVTLNGLTPVALVNTYYRINLLTALTAGTSETNVGTVTVRTTVGASPLHAILSGYGRGQTAVYTVPAGFTAFMLDGYFNQYNLANNAFSAFHIEVRPVGGVWTNRAFVTTSEATPTVGLQPRLLSPCFAGSDIRIRAFQVGTNDTQLTASISLILVAS